MTEASDTPTGPDDVSALAALDQALDGLAAPAGGTSVPAGELGALAAGAALAGEPAALAGLAADLRTAVPAPPPGAAERGRAAFLARAAELGPAVPAARRPWRRGGGGAARWRSLPLRVVALAAALVVLVAVPAAVARQARPGTTLWPLREVGQQIRVSLADDPVHRAELQLNTAASYLSAGSGAGEERRKQMADQAEEKIEDALDALEGIAGPRAEAEQARAEQLLLEVEALERQKDPGDRSGPGSGSEPSGRGGGDDDRSGSGGDDPSGGGDRSGRVGGSGSGGGSSGSGSSGSGRGGSDDD
jgi:polyhydroxyalkanoate synthesis regulator phasin